MEKIKSYADLPFHQEIGGIIQKYSENTADIRTVAVGLVNLEETKNILDLGCGYGWFEMGLKGSFAHIHGIDCYKENRSTFLKYASKVARKATFQELMLPAPISMVEGYFDLIVAAYSLYFFPGIIPEAARLLKRGGSFLAITHSESMLEEGERYFDFKNLRKVIQHFSAENGEQILCKTFINVRTVQYKNALVFRSNDAEGLKKYITFKKEFIVRDVDPDLVKEKMLAELRCKGVVRLNKDDTIFVVSK